MACTTRSGLQWSPWELDGVAPVVPDFYRSKVSLAPHLAQALALTDLRAEALGSSMGDEDAWEDEPRVFLPPSPPPSFKRRQNTGKKARRQRSRVAAAKTAVFGPPPKARHVEGYNLHHTTTNPTVFASVASNCLQALLKDGHDLIRWDGVRPKLILDADGRIEARRVMDQVRAHGEKRGVFAGFTKGPGQKKPGNLAHSKGHRQLLDPIIKNRAIRRMAGFQSSGLARYLPKLYQYQTTTMKGLCRTHPELKRPFDNSCFQR
ncbi:hypothetical protein B0H14DRAFT_3433504 [Mycena olivaceomarginata]|nr:hypothetical protein B0H14DRAFT_3433504 [Mycena olivaceomarginata]